MEKRLRLFSKWPYEHKISPPYLKRYLYNGGLKRLLIVKKQELFKHPLSSNTCDSVLFHA